MAPNDDGSPRGLRQAETWLFDLDNTLYPAHCNLFDQIDRRMGEFISRLFGETLDQAKQRQKTYFRTYGTTLRGLMVEHGLDPKSFLDYVHDIDLAGLAPAPRLDRALAALPGRKLVFTNGSVAHADRVMRRLGIDRHFSAIFDIAAAGFVPKPARQTYEQLCAAHAVEPNRAVMVEDIARNLEPAHALGMTTVWVPAGEDWRSGDTAAHIHHVVEDLAGWLENLPAAAD